MEKEAKRLRKGFTTGTAAAAAGKAAALALFSGKRVKEVEVTLPASRGNPATIKIPIKSVEIKDNSATACVIKDAGDDPDVTNGALIVASLSLAPTSREKKSTKRSKGRIFIKGGEGVGRVTRPGLAITPGRAAINPVPLKMIRRSVREVIEQIDTLPVPSVTVTVSVPSGLEISKKTMNARLGIVGGISILGTTGIVEPLSLSAYRDSIVCALDVAVAGGLQEVVFSTGRSSEKVAEKLLKLDERAFILTGDHMGYALEAASARKEIKRVSVVGQFGKFTKLASGHFKTHCTESSVELGFLADLAEENGAKGAIIKKIIGANTAREVFLLLKEKGFDKVIAAACALVRRNSLEFFPKGIKVRSILVG
ncbi:MAG: cobalt-precorrin-5B (C(1))-methyltransferase CbiD, partial [Thermodesulfobacteriota bacterium]